MNFIDLFNALAGHVRPAFNENLPITTLDIAFSETCLALECLIPDDFQATSYKPLIGHTMGASGLLESILLIDSLKNGTMPAIKNRTEVDRKFLSEPVATPDKLILSLAAGMGNVYSAAVLSMDT